MSNSRSYAKQAVKGVFNLLVLPVYFLYLGCRLTQGSHRAFAGFSQGLSLIPGLSGIYIRHAFYRFVLPQCGDDIVVSFGTLLTHPATHLGRACYIGPFTTLGEVTVGDDALLGSYVSVINGGRQHGIDRLDIPIRDQPGQWPRVTLGADCWIGERAVVMADVGRGAVVAAGSVVTRPVPPFMIVAGVPARPIRCRTRLSASSSSPGDKDGTTAGTEMECRDA